MAKYMVFPCSVPLIFQTALWHRGEQTRQPSNHKPAGFIQQVGCSTFQQGTNAEVLQYSVTTAARTYETERPQVLPSETDQGKQRAAVPGTAFTGSANAERPRSSVNGISRERRTLSVDFAALPGRGRKVRERTPPQIRAGLTE